MESLDLPRLGLVLKVVFSDRHLDNRLIMSTFMRHHFQVAIHEDHHDKGSFQNEKKWKMWKFSRSTGPPQCGNFRPICPFVAVSPVKHRKNCETALTPGIQSIPGL